MREKIKIGWKLMPYGTNLQLQLVCFVIIGFVGLSWEFFQAAFDNNLNVVSFCGGDLGGFFLMLSGNSWPGQVRILCSVPGGPSTWWSCSGI